MMFFENRTLTPAESWRNVLVFAALALVLVIPGGPAWLTLILVAMGLQDVAKWRGRWVQVGSWPQVRFMAMAYGVFVGAGVFLGLWYGYDLGYYEAFIPFILAPLVLNGVLGARLQPAVLWLGAATGALTAGLYASFQSLVLSAGRATGAMNHPIIFGDLAVVLACIALFGVLYFEQAKRTWWLRAWLLFGAAMGVWASLLSGTKGGWFSIVMVLFVFAWRVTAGKPVLWRYLGVLCIAALVAKGVLLAPEALVRGRLEGVLHSVQNWFVTGEVIDWSVSIRLELWSYALKLFAERPVLGWSGPGALAKLAEHLRPFNVPAGIAPVFENDLLHYAAVSGLVGVLSVVALYVGVFTGFWQFRKLKLSEQTAAYVLLGMLLVVLIFEFGLTVNALGRNAFRYFFCTLSVMLLGLVLMSMKGHKGD